MKRYVLILVSSLTLFSLSLAQTTTPGRPTDPAVRARIQAMRPIFDLVGQISLLQEMDLQKGLTLTKAQAKLLLPILKDLQARADLKAKDATLILVKIEDKILNQKQVAWLDDTQLKREEERRQRFQNGGGQAGNGAPTGGVGRGGMFQAMQAGKPFNPFKDERVGKPLGELIVVLAKR